MIFVFTVLFLILDFARAHGRLSVPSTRNPTGYENDPVPSNNDDTFVCRNDVTDPATTINAGSTLDLYWDFGAAHVGDCAVYISYDWDTSNKAEQAYFKIANLYKCKDQNRETVPIDLPSWLPGGRAVLRWDWTALHVYPTVEFYAQCADVTIVAGAGEVDISTLVTYPIINPAVYPADGNSGVGYRNPFANTEQYMTGPPCANGYSSNSCELTQDGTTGFIYVGDITPVQSPTNEPSNAGDTPTEEPTYASICETYEVGDGDTISSIATSYTDNGMAVTWDEICTFNELEDCDVIDIGDDLMIPCDSCGCTIGGLVIGSSSKSNTVQAVVGVILALIFIVGGLGYAYHKGYRFQDNKIVNINEATTGNTNDGI